LDPHPGGAVLRAAAGDADDAPLGLDLPAVGQAELDVQQLAHLEQEIGAQERTAAGEVGRGKPDRTAHLVAGVGDGDQDLEVDAGVLAGVAADRAGAHGRSSAATAERISTDTRAPEAASGSRA